MFRDSLYSFVRIDTSGFTVKSHTTEVVSRVGSWITFRHDIAEIDVYPLIFYGKDKGGLLSIQ
jgi:hypothetical protein